MKRVLNILFPTLTILALLFIFSNSLSSGAEAGAKRGFVVGILQNVISFFTGKEIIFDEKALAVVSKLFHVFEFCLFSFFLTFSLYLRREGFENVFWQVLLCGVFSALADEQLQMLSVNRGPRLSDVYVDLAGILIGFAVSFVLITIVFGKKRNESDSSVS